jgi:4-methyl-5(b-hydroxyethyl)-thiazole monophosphate biosynthesis
MPGAKNLNEHEGVRQALLRQHEAGRRIGAICAAPLVLGGLGLLKGRRATCYPGFEETLTGAEYTAELVTVDGNITTGRGPAAALPYGYQLLSYFADEVTIAALEQGMIYQQLLAEA